MPEPPTDLFTIRPKSSAFSAKPVKQRRRLTVSAKSSSTDVRKTNADSRNKKDKVIALMARHKGATLAEIAALAGWQRHTVRGFISTLGKKDLKIESFKSAKGERTY